MDCTIFVLQVPLQADIPLLSLCDVTLIVLIASLLLWIKRIFQDYFVLLWAWTIFLNLFCDLYWFLGVHYIIRKQESLFLAEKMFMVFPHVRFFFLKIIKLYYSSVFLWCLLDSVSCFKRPFPHSRFHTKFLCLFLFLV